MKRFHIHVHVTDLDKNVDFYSKMFGAQPARVESDYAKWMLDEPAVNFAISTRGHGHTGVDHLGIQVDSDEELATLKAQADAADFALVNEGATTCCYARSNKHWVVDPQRVPWEHFHTLDSIPVFREEAGSCAPAATTQVTVGAVGDVPSGCAPKVTGKPVGIPVKSACC